MKNKVYQFGIATAIYFLMGCSNESPSNPDEQSAQTQIEDNFNLWESSDIRNYSYKHFSSPTDCPQADVMPPSIVTVENSLVVSAYVTELDNTLEINNAKTIDDIFDSIVDILESSPEYFFIEFDDEKGFPSNYTIDQTNQECDGVTVTISEFQAACEDPVAFTNTKNGSEYGYLVDIRDGYDIDETATRYLEKYEDLEVYSVNSYVFHANSSDSTLLQLRCEPEVEYISWNLAMGLY